MEQVDVSVLVPVLDEERHIGIAAEAMLAQRILENPRRSTPIARGDGRWSRRVALALTTRLGTGGAGFRHDAGDEVEVEVDSGFTGIWSRSTLARQYWRIVLTFMHVPYGLGFLSGSIRFGPPVRALAHLARQLSR